MQTTTDKGQTGPLGRVDPSLPQVFGRYLLVQRLSRGGMGEIFLAKHGLAGFEKLAVIKKVLPHLAADAQFISRFVDEAQVAIKLQHVNVAQVFEVGRVGDEYFLALEYVEGRDLRRTLALLQQRAQRLPVDLALFIGRELANGLAYAHRRTTSDGASLNLVHCDISPPNVLVSFEGETKVIDFGIAKSAMRGTATDPKMGFGKFGYMAPEQLIRGGVVDHRTDIYAAGVVLFELLTNKRLYEAGPEPDYRALAKKVAKGEHTMPSQVDKVLAPYDDLVATALRPKTSDRYQTAAEFRDAIQQALVNVNPTISTDQLGSYMRDLFSMEMTAQRELHDRVAKAHLADFQDELTKETGTTVSFAMANMPLQAPPETNAPPRPPRLPARVTGQQRPRPPTLPTDILPQQPPQPPPIPTAAIPTQEIGLADGTGAVPPEDLSLPAEKLKTSKAPLVIGLFAVVAAVAVVVVVMVGKTEPPAQVAHQQPPKRIVVESIAPDEQTPPKAQGSAAEVKVEPKVEQKVEKIDTPPAKVDTPPKSEKTERKKHHSSTEKKTPPPVKVEAPAKPELTKEAVIAKFRQARAAYEAYEKRNGGRYDNEWSELVKYQQYHPEDFEGFAQRIESFRAKLRE